MKKMPDEVNMDPNHLDVDILVDDYCKVKRILDRDSPEELCTVLIDGKRINFDVRSIGDDYLDKKWQQDILERRTEYHSSIR